LEKRDHVPEESTVLTIEQHLLLSKPRHIERASPNEQRIKHPILHDRSPATSRQGTPGHGEGNAEGVPHSPPPSLNACVKPLSFSVPNALHPHILPRPSTQLLSTHSTIPVARSLFLSKRAQNCIAIIKDSESPNMLTCFFSFRSSSLNSLSPPVPLSTYPLIISETSFTAAMTEWLHLTRRDNAAATLATAATVAAKEVSGRGGGVGGYKVSADVLRPNDGGKNVK
jgi:hypothetical protein